MTCGVGGVAGEGPAPHRDPVAGDRHRDHHLRQVGAVVLGVPEPARPGLGRVAGLVIGDRLGEIDVVVGGLGLPVGGGGVDEHDVQIKVEQVRNRGEHLRGDLIESVEQEVHRGVRGVLGEPRAALDRDPLRDPTGRGQLGSGLTRPLRDECEHHPLDRVAVETTARGNLADRRTDPEAFPDPVQRPRRAQAPRVQHLDLSARRGCCGHGLPRGQEPRDRGHQPGQRSPVDLVGPPEAVDHLRDRVPADRVPLVVRQLQVAHHRAVRVGPPCLPQEHAYN